MAIDPGTAGMNLPDGLSPDDVMAHAAMVSRVARLINLTSEYGDAPSGSPEESMAERRLDEFAASLDADQSAGIACLILATLIVETGDESRVQEWFDHQAARIRAVIGDG